MYMIRIYDHVVSLLPLLVIKLIGAWLIGSMLIQQMYNLFKHTVDQLLTNAMYSVL